MSKTTFLSLLLLTGLAGIFIFLIWLAWIMGPVAVVEVRYQYQKTLKELFKTQTLAGVFLPNLRTSTQTTYGTNREGGLVIPAIFLDEPVIFNVDPNDEKSYKDALQRGIAHASSTALPDTPGMGYYFAHSSAAEFARQYNAIFYLLGKLKEGDDIYIWHEGRDARYKVVEKAMTEPSDVSFLKREFDHEAVVLQTCWPPGTTSKRLLVFAKRID